ncbi:MAG: hypothetical protein OXU79_11795 [Gemmatimonadota bacterium]|nr:hypothetical protein [Gemmatimonadota bacterium]
MEIEERRRLVATIVAGIVASPDGAWSVLRNLGYSPAEAGGIDPIHAANLIVDEILRWPRQRGDGNG